MDDPRRFVKAQDLTKEEWDEIHLIAVKLFHQKRFGDNQLKVGIFAFLIWLDMQNAILEFSEDDFSTYYH